MNTTRGPASAHFAGVFGGLRAVRHRTFRAMLSPLPDRFVVQVLYLRTMGRCVNMDQPRTMTEKINWRKIEQRDPRFTAYSDKVEVKKLIGELVGVDHVVPTLWVGNSPDDLPFDSLEPPYVIKTTHSTNNNIFIRCESDIDRSSIRARLQSWLDHDHAIVLREWAYRAIPRRIMVERMLLTDTGRVPDDYKFFVFGGRVRFVQFDHDRFGDHTRAFFDADWHRLPVAVLYPPYPGEVRRPERFDEMFAVAETIGRGFDFVRVDLYETEEGVHFGETTFYPGGGLDRFEPAEWDAEFGRHWQIAGREQRTVAAAEIGTDPAFPKRF